MLYISCLLVGALIIFVTNRYFARLKHKEAELVRELEILKAKDITDELRRMELGDLVKRSNERAAGTPTQVESRRRSRTQ